MVEISNYLVYRVQMRSHLPDVTRTEVGEIWHNSEPIAEDRDDGRERRYNENHDIILIKREGVVKTVLSGKYIEKMYEGDFCEWCGKNTFSEDSCDKCCGRCLDEGSRSAL